jgi:CelD/BcsL family acetyltransferase involved in cellulose biosynthesis
MKTDLLPLTELSNRDLLEWRDLADRATEPNPFFDPDFVVPAAQALGVEDKVALAVRRDSSGWSACAPVRRQQLWRTLPVTCLATWRHVYCLLGTPLIAAGEETAATADLIAAMRRLKRVDCAALEWVSTDGPVAAALSEAAGSRAIWLERFQRATLVRQPSGDYLEGRVKGKELRELRRRSRKLEEELGGETRLVDRSDDPRALESFIELEASGWKGEKGTALASNPSHTGFLRKVADAFAARDALNLVFLEAGDTPVAATCNLVAGGVDFCFKVGYDERYARFGPGRELQLKMIDDFHAEPSLQMVDSCTSPGNELYSRLWRDQRELATTVVPAPGPRGLVVYGALRAATAYRERRREPSVD